ncbi:hypothetical protein [Burkholderia sp. USMB20]|uniref:hypothetical protein n=1 Tax=Burkholderia sp. USMB20 TaxID=1571773 RepID=UPI003FA41891
MRGILTERGIVFAQSITRARREIPAVVADTSNALTPLAREMLADLMDQLRELDKRIAGFDRRIDAVFKASETCQRIAQIEGVGPRTATAIVAAVSDPKASETAVTLRPGSALFPVRAPAETERTCSASASEATDIYVPCSYTVPARCSEPHPPSMTRSTPGLLLRKPDEAPTEPLSRSRTRWPVSSGRCSQPASRIRKQCSNVTNDALTN